MGSFSGSLLDVNAIPGLSRGPYPARQVRVWFPAGRLRQKEERQMIMRANPGRQNKDRVFKLAD